MSVRSVLRFLRLCWEWCGSLSLLLVALLGILVVRREVFEIVDSAVVRKVAILFFVAVLYLMYLYLRYWWKVRERREVDRNGDDKDSVVG